MNDQSKPAGLGTLAGNAANLSLIRSTGLMRAPEILPEGDWSTTSSTVELALLETLDLRSGQTSDTTRATGRREAYRAGIALNAPVGRGFA